MINVLPVGTITDGNAYFSVRTTKATASGAILRIGCPSADGHCLFDSSDAHFSWSAMSARFVESSN